MDAVFGIAAFAAMMYGIYALVRLIVCAAKSQEKKPWLKKLGASAVAFVVFIIGLGSTTRPVSKNASQTPVASVEQPPVGQPSAKQKTPAEIAAEQKVEEERKAEAERKEKEEAERKAQAEREAEIARKKEAAARQAAEKQTELDAIRAKERAEREKYKPISADTLLRAANSNAAKAKKDFNGKLFRITGGFVQNIDSDSYRVDVTSSYAEQEFTLLQICCHPKNDAVKQKILNLSKGQPVTIFGQVTDVGDIMGYDVNLYDIQ